MASTDRNPSAAQISTQRRTGDPGRRHRRAKRGEAESFIIRDDFMKSGRSNMQSAATTPVRLLMNYVLIFRRQLQNTFKCAQVVKLVRTHPLSDSRVRCALIVLTRIALLLGDLSRPMKTAFIASMSTVRDFALSRLSAASTFSAGCTASPATQGRFTEQSLCEAVRSDRSS
jgi:hypothetical protein